MNLDLLFLAQATGEAGGFSGYMPLLMIVGFFAIFYFLLIRPQKKREKELKSQVSTMTKGDRFMTAGGIYATVVGIKDDIIVAKIADDVKVEINKNAITRVVAKGEV